MKHLKHTHTVEEGDKRGTVALACGELRINKLKAVRTRQKWRKYADLEGMGKKSSRDENYVGKKHKKEQKEKIREAEVQRGEVLYPDILGERNQRPGELK